MIATAVSVDSLVDRIEALRRFVAVASPYLPADLVAPARAVTGRAGERLALSRDHTVVALAGATGSGKSSLFNALAGAKLSTVGVRRPTTGATHASVWGPGDAGPLLDWLGVSRRFGQDGGDETLRGLILLDLPDLDSVEDTHRAEVDRVLALVDLVVWVLDPQKYADKVLHRRYLSQFRRHRDITVVVLNQADLLPPSDVERCLTDLRGLLASDGLTGVPVFATSAMSTGAETSSGSEPSAGGGPGIEPLTATLRDTVAARLAMLHRLAADVDVVAAQLAALVESEPPRGEVDRGPARELIEALENAAGVPIVVRATERAYVYRAVAATGWPLTKWIRRLRPDPLRSLHLSPVAAAASALTRSGPRTATPGSSTPRSVEVPGPDPSALEPQGDAAAPVAVTSVPAAAPAARAAVGLAVRNVAERAGQGLPDPWPDAVLVAARSRSGDLTDALDDAVARTDLGLDRRPLWWRAVGLVQWLTALVALGGLLWLGVRLGLFAVGLPDLVPAPTAGRFPVPTLMLFGGLLAGLLVSIVVRPVILIAARRKGSRARSRLRAGVERVGTDLVLAPVREVRQAYREARSAVRTAAHR